jgi:glycosyltransferase involved in cell wall biosynthesis
MTMPRANVLHVVDSLGLGGTQTILKGYFESRPEDRSIALLGLRKLDRELAIHHPNVGVSPSRGRFSLSPLRDLARRVDRHSAGILHCHLFRAQAFGLVFKALSRKPLALVFHEHGRAVGTEGESAVEALLFRLFLKLGWRLVDRFICISEHTRTRLLEVIPRASDRATVVSNPVALRPAAPSSEADRRAAREALGIPDDAFVVGFASRLVTRKGWRDFLDAIARVPATCRPFFLIAGDGEDEGRVARHIQEAGLAGKGRTLGFTDRMETFYRALDAFTMPSHWEPHGLTHLEAQGFGVPVIVSDVPGLADTVHGGVDALVVPAGDVDALAAAITRLATEPALRERLAAAGRTNGARFSTDAFAEKLEALYAGLRPATAATVPAR